MRYLLYIVPAIVCAFFVATMTLAQGTGTINQLDQWRRTATGQITQNIPNSILRLTGYESPGFCLVTDSFGNVSTSTCGTGGGGTPGGSNGQLQFNNGGSFGGTSTPSVTAINATNTAATSTLPNIISQAIRSLTSAGLTFFSNGGTPIADFGAGGGSNASFFGGVNIDGQTRLATSLTGLLKGTSGVVSVATPGTDYVATTTGDWTGTFDGQEGSFYLNRANHTGTQLSSTISDFTTQVQALSVGTTSAGTTGSLAFWTGARTLGNVATGTLTENATGLTLSGTPAVIGGSSVLTIDTGFTLASTSGLSNLYTFYDTPSNRITAGTGLSWSGNTLNGQPLGFASSSPFTTGDLVFASNAGRLNTVATGTLTENVTGLELSATRALVGGAAILNLTSGFVIPTSTLWTQVADFYTTPSTRITAGSNCSWAGNTFNCTGGSGTIGTTSALTTGQVLFATGASTTASRATTTLVAGTGITFSGGTPIIIGSSPITIESTGGGGGGSLSTTTDIVGDGAASTVSYVTTDVMFGGSASTSAEFLFDKDGAKLIIASTSNGAATSTWANVNTAQALEFGVSSTTGSMVRGLFWSFSSSTRALVGGFGGVVDLTFDTNVFLARGLKDVTGSLGTLGMVLTSTGTSTRWVATSSLGISGGGGGSSNWTDNGTFLTPLTSTDGLLVTGSSTFSQLRFDNATSTGSLWLGNNRLWQHPAQFLDIQRTGSDYTLARIRAPRGSSREATLALVVDLSTTDAGVDEEFVDFYNERYGDSLQWGLRQAYSGTGIAKPFVLGHWQTSGSKDAGNKLIVMPHGTVAVARATSTIPVTTAFYVASSTAPNLVRFDSAPGTAEFVVENDGDTGVGTSTPSAALSVVAQVASTIANFFTSTGQLVMSIASNLVTIFGDVDITGSLTVATTTYYGATTSDAVIAAGYINTGNWIEEFCTSPTAEITQIGADTLRLCGRFSALEDANGVIDFIRPTTGSSTYFRMRPGATGATTVAGDGIAIGWADGLDMGDLQRFRPAMEFALKQDTLANATATLIFAGITDKVTVGVDAATEPGVGFYVYATSTANWLFACNPQTGGTTYIDTGIASSSFATGNANPWTHFRLEVGGTTNTAVTGLLKARVQSTRQFTQVGACSIDLAASTAAAAPIVAIGKSTAGSSPELHVPWVKFWYYNQLY